MAKSKILVRYTFGLTYHILYMCIHPVKEEGEREEGKRGNYLLGFSLKKPFKPLPGWPWVGAVPYQALSLSFDFSCVKMRKGEGKPG